MRRALVRGQEVRDEVAIAADWHSLESRHLVEGDVLPDEIAVRWVRAARELRFPPSVQAIPDAGLPANLRCHPAALFDDEVLRFTVACVMHDSALQVKAALDVLRTYPAQ